MSIPTALDGERGIPEVQRLTPAPWRKGAAIVIGAAGLIAVSAYAVVKLSPDGTVEAVTEQRVMVKASTVPARVFAIQPDPLPEPIAALPAVEPAPEPETVIVERVVYRAPPTPVIDKARSRSLVERSHEQGNDIAQATNAAPTSLQTGFLGQQGEKTQITAQTGGVSRAYASTLLNRDTLITRGAMIGCVLNTSLNSQLSGMTSCRVTRDVYSTDGRQVLIQGGSIVTGEYQSAIAQGMNRIGVIWDRVQTPGGVIVDLQSPTTDALGGTGIQGRVNNHFWKRFGGAILLSLVDDVASAATSSNSSGQVVVNSATGAGSDLAAEVLRNTINIPPTIEVHQGGRINIFISRDLDFGGVL